MRVRARAACDTCQENKIGMRWRTQKEVFSGKGQFACGNIACDSRDDLSSYEVHYPPPPPFHSFVLLPRALLPLTRDLCA